MKIIKKLKIIFVLSLLIIISIVSYVSSAITFIDNQKTGGDVTDKLVLNLLNDDNSEFDTIFFDGFERDTFPPDGWEQQVKNEGYTWHLDVINAFQGNQSARCLHDPSKTSQDEWLITPTINLSGLRELYLQFNWFMSYFWSVNPYHNYDLNVYFVNENKSDWQLIWNQNQVGPFENWVWYTTAIDLSTYQNGNLFRIGFQYNGSDGAQVNIDNIGIYGRKITNPPIVDAGGPYYGYVGEEINFYGNVTGGKSPYSWTWDFGDGSRFHQQFLTHSYDTFGNYTIKLSVTDADGISDTDETTATVINMSKVPELIITNISGLLGIHAVIVNKGCVDATNIYWTLLVNGGIMNSIDILDTGFISCVNIKCSQEISSNLVYGFGLVDITVLVDADNMNRISGKCKAIILGRLVYPLIN